MIGSSSSNERVIGFAKLANELSPEQIDLVKDKMTYGKLKVTYDAYFVKEYLNAHGHDVAKAYKDWNAKQEQAKAREKK